MGTIKNAIYKIDNGADFDEIHFKTNSDQVMCGSTTLTSQLAHIKTYNILDYGAKGDGSDDSIPLNNNAFKTIKELIISAV